MYTMNNLSPESKQRSLSFKKLDQEDNTQNIYKSCFGCGTDRRLLILSTQIFMSGFVIIFCCAMITSEEDKTLYISLLSSTLSFWLGKHSLTD